MTMTLGFICVLQDGLHSSSTCNKVTHFGVASDSLCSKFSLIPELRLDMDCFIVLVLDLVMGPPMSRDPPQDIVLMLGESGNLVKQETKCCKEKYRAIANGVCKMLWLKRVIEELQMPIHMSMKFYCDNKTNISIAQNPVQHDHTKHVEINRHFIKEKIECGVICLPFVPYVQQITDIFTKGLYKPSFEMFGSKLGMLNICSNLRGSVGFLGGISTKLGHVNFKHISKLYKKGLVKGLHEMSWKTHLLYKTC
ncbi:Copia protein, partial [Mucuna pruriens]